MAAGMALIGIGLLWATQAGHGHYWSSLLGPFFVTGLGTAFAFIPVSIAALAGVERHEAGLASGLINTAQQVGGAIGVAVMSSVSITHFKHLVQSGTPAPQAFTSGTQWAFWVTAGIAVVGLIATVTLIRTNELGAMEEVTVQV